MATILKWWKMKMLGGYKHMPGLISESDCDPSLVGGSQRSSSFCCRGHRCPSSTDETHLCDESEHDCDEDACSVTSEGTCQPEPEQEHEEMTRPASPNTPEKTPPPANPRDEFNFTLYDFDGHGKVTKDDIAGLVRAIYDVMGSSVKVPPSGSKTIHVKLTVTPEQAAARRAANQRDLNITIRGDSAEQADKEEAKLEPSRRPRSQSVRVAPTATPQGRPPLADHNAKKNLMDALQLGLQANKAKINLKRHHSDRDHLRRRLQPRQPSDARCCPPGRAACARDATPEATPGCGQCVRERWNRRHAGCRARPCQERPAASSPPPPQQQERCYQEDDYELLTRCAAFALREAHEKQEALSRNRQKAAHGHGGGGGGGSPHHHMKHRNRERDHYRAMQQVLSWLEREHPTPPAAAATSPAASPAAPAAASPAAAGCGCGKTCAAHQTPPATPAGAPAPQPVQTVQTTTTTVEHHHRHEHVHHHYHHFANGAVIL